jgi:hypothetical protein
VASVISPDLKLFSIATAAVLDTVVLNLRGSASFQRLLFDLRDLETFNSPSSILETQVQSLEVSRQDATFEFDLPHTVRLNPDSGSFIVFTDREDTHSSGIFVSLILFIVVWMH